LSASIIALLPLSHNEASIVWSAENHLADELLALSPEAFAKNAHHLHQLITSIEVAVHHSNLNNNLA
jgi:2-polyprenyl-6-methoxyphenol hydroxylase-like FAD-dependent oxidoreductase